VSALPARNAADRLRGRERVITVRFFKSRPIFEISPDLTKERH